MIVALEFISLFAFFEFADDDVAQADGDGSDDEVEPEGVVFFRWFFGRLFDFDIFKLQQVVAFFEDHGFVVGNVVDRWGG